MTIVTPICPLKSYSDSSLECLNNMIINSILQVFLNIALNK